MVEIVEGGIWEVVGAGADAGAVAGKEVDV